jgi:hypothetical protein
MPLFDVTKSNLRACRECRAVFLPAHRNQFYCSLREANRAASRRWRELHGPRKQYRKAKPGPTPVVVDQGMIA